MITPKGVASVFDSIRADYDATRQSRFVRRRTGVAAMGSNADYHFRSESKYYDLIEQARDMDRNDSLVGILADRRVDNIVQSGFTLDPKTGDKKLDLDLWQRWEDFSNDSDACDVTGEMTWKEIERICCRAESIDGDIVVIGTESGHFQTIEAHTIQTSTKIENTFLGVTRDQYGKRLQYHLREELNEFASKGQSRPVDVRNSQGVRQLFHVYNPKRSTETRGVTQLAPVFSMSGMLEDVNFAKLVQQQVVSCFAIFRKMAAGSNGLPSVDGYGDKTTEQASSGTRQIEGVSPGMEIIGHPGEELQGFSPNVPNSEYFQQVKLLLQIIGVNFGLPLCLVLMDGSETNFSGWRGAVDEARKGFVADQKNLVRRLNEPAYRWKLSQWIEKDAALKRAAKKLGGKIFNHNWNLPTWSYIEPVADAEGDAKQLRNALTSPRRMHAARGKDWETIAEEIVEDNVYAIERGQSKANELNAKLGTTLTWRDLIALPMQEGTTVAMQDPTLVASQDTAAEGQPTEDGVAVDMEKRNVAAEALNGAQVTSLVEIINQIAAGVLPKDTAKALISAAFPLISQAVIDEIVDPVEPGTVAIDGAATPVQGVEASDEPTGEFAGISTQQWNRNRKAVQKILDELAAGTTSEQAARVFLGGVGLAQKSIDILIADAMDGQVDTPEVLNDAA